MSLIHVHPPKTYFGAGDIQKSLGSHPGFPWAKYPGEKHLPGHNYTGPGTRLDLRLDENDIPKPGEEPVNRVDAAALKHDILYRNKDVTFRHQADKQMIDELENIPNPTFKEKLQRALIVKLLKAKLKLDDKITKVKIDVQRLIDNPNVNEDRLKRKLTALERKLGELLAELDKTADKTELQNSISNLNEKIAKQKSDVQDIINTLPIDKDTLKQQLTALDTKITDELEKEVGVIKNFLQNKFRDDMKIYIKEQVNLLVSRIHDDLLRQERKLSKLEAIVTDKSYYFNLPFESDTVFDRKDQIYKSNKYGFKAEIKVGSLAYGEPKNLFDIGETEVFTFRENIRLIDKRVQEIETKNGKYLDTFKMEVENDKDIIGIKDLDMILETENPPSTNIVKVPPSLIIPGPIESGSHEFLRTTDFEYVKLYFVLGGKYTSIDVHKSQQEREFIVHLSFAEGSDSILEGGGFISRAKINIEKEKRKYSYHLNEDHTKKKMPLVRVNVFTFNTRKYNNARPNKHALYDIPWFHLSEIHLI
ncbi:hypothetical protein LOTGIDRAFT_174278 [Lottia gigantea]|uniref:Phospholipase A2-like domain-containing protein n=1 Tax=Lottia gigantea TaxID=225164 RepID=V4AMU4_LOTGI|nr:hypothetical protein LOTGIDRAFT_174278 [Lottia gigantea]ESO98467.1 hypothetical protein LOTGIDRAFT_174278 [Lottia gigantea]